MFLITWFWSLPNFEDFDSNLLRIDQKSYKNIHIYYAGCLTINSISDYNSVSSVNPL